MSQVLRPTSGANVSGIAVFLDATRRAVIRMALAELCWFGGSGVNVLLPLSQVPYSMSAFRSSTTELPSQLFAAAAATALSAAADRSAVDTPVAEGPAVPGRPTMQQASKRFSDEQRKAVTQAVIAAE